MLKAQALFTRQQCSCVLEIII
eukprot:UN05196